MLRSGYNKVLNGYFPLSLIQREYRKYLPVALTQDGETYTSNYDVQKLLDTPDLMKQIQHQVMERYLAPVYSGDVDADYKDPKGKI